LLSRKEITNSFENLESRNLALDKAIDNEVTQINNLLDKKNLKNEDELCLLYRKNELLNLRGNKANKMAKVQTVEAPKQKSKTKKVEVIEDQEPTNSTPIAARMASVRDTLVMINAAATPDTNLYMSKIEFNNLRREIGNLRQEILAYESKDKSGTVKIIRDTITIEKRVEIEKPIIVEKIVERVVEKPVIQYVEKIVEKTVPVEKIIERNFTKVEELLAIPPDVVLFDIGKSNIKPQYNSRLNFYGAQLKKYKDLKVMLSGFTDASGNAASNKILSEKRAAAVKAYLIAHGATANQIQTEFFGADNPIADNNNAGNKSQNRRVELKFEK
jgi:outer membrane protein OmpA-like peptidoglycan-associated protein